MTTRKKLSLYFVAIFLIPPCMGIAKSDSDYTTAKLVAMSETTITKTRFTGEPFGNVHFMTATPYKAIVYNMTVEIEDVRYELAYEVKSRWDYVPPFNVGDSLEVRMEASGEKMLIKRSDGKDFKAKILQVARMTSHES